MPSIKKLVEQLNSYDEEEQEKAAEALGEAGGPKARKTLEEALEKKPSSLVKVAIWKSLIQLGEEKRLNELIKFVESGGDPRALRKAFIAFKELKRREVLPLLVNILSHPDRKCIPTFICQEAVRAFKELGDQSYLPLLKKAREFCNDGEVIKILDETIERFTFPHTEVTVTVMLIDKGIIKTLPIPCEAKACDLKEILNSETGIPLSRSQVIINKKTLRDEEQIKAKTGDRIYIA